MINILDDKKTIQVPDRSIFGRHENLDICNTIRKALGTRVNPYISYEGGTDIETLSIKVFLPDRENSEFTGWIVIRHRYKGNGLSVQGHITDEKGFDRLVYEGSDLFEQLPAFIGEAYGKMSAYIGKKLMDRENKNNQFIIDYSDRIAQLDEKARKYGFKVKSEYLDDDKEYSIVLVDPTEDPSTWDSDLVDLRTDPPRLYDNNSYASDILGNVTSSIEGFKSFDEMFRFLDVMIVQTGKYVRFKKENESKLSKFIHYDEDDDD